MKSSFLRGFTSAAFAVALLFVAGSVSAQGLRVTEPAAGAEVGETFDIEIEGEPGEVVRINIDSEEVARLKLGRDGLAQARVQAPESSPFTLLVEQLAGEEVIALTSIRLKLSDQIELDELDATPAPAQPKDVDPTSDDLPPPPPPPDVAGEPSDTFEKESVEAPAPPEVEDPQATEDDVGDGLPTTTTVPKPLKPRGGTRLIRILISGTVGIFAVPTGWFLGVLGAGLLTNFDDDVVNDNSIAWIFLSSGVLAAATGTWISGEMLKGNGSFLWTLGGAVLVGVLSTFAIQVDDSTGEQDFLVGSLLGSFASIGGAIIGYEVTSDTDADFSTKTGIHDAMIGAAPTPDGSGFTIGLTGRF